MLWPCKGWQNIYKHKKKKNCHKVKVKRKFVNKWSCSLNRFQPGTPLIVMKIPKAPSVQICYRQNLTILVLGMLFECVQ